MSSLNPFVAGCPGVSGVDLVALLAVRLVENMAINSTVPAAEAVKTLFFTQLLLFLEL